MIAIINEKIEGFLEYFTNNQDTFKEIQLNYYDNKKICELIQEILDLIWSKGKGSDLSINGSRSRGTSNKSKIENNLIEVTFKINRIDG